MNWETIRIVLICGNCICAVLSAVKSNYGLMGLNLFAAAVLMMTE
jgi:hypothetical protein